MLDDVDLTLVRALARDARATNQSLAAEAGIAPSTCLSRVRSLMTRGVIRGFHADVATEALGLDLRAIISVRLQPQSRGNITQFSQRIAALPQVMNLYFVAGADDFLLDVVAADTAQLREFVVVHLSKNKDVANTQTSLVFEHVRGSGIR